MEILEPTTMLTDYVLAGMGVWLGCRLIRQGAGSAAGRLTPTALWGVSFLALALGAVAGGTSHGFAAYLGETGQAFAWKLTVYAIGLTSLAFLIASALAYLRGGARKLLVALAMAQFVGYAWWMATHDDFRYVIYDYLPAMTVVLALALWAWRSRSSSSGRWVVAGILVSFAAAAVQMTGWVWHKYFNHNDLYHLVQMLGLYLLFRGGRLLRLAVEPGARPSVSGS